jgi:hypothetical protein
MATKEQLEKHKQFLLDQDQKRRQADADRKQNVLSADYSAYADYNSLLGSLTSDEIRLLKNQSPSFKKRIEELDTIFGFRQLSEEDQAIFFAQANEGTRIVLENDGYIASQTLTLTESADEAEQRKAEEAAAALAAEQTAVDEESDREAANALRLQAEADRLSAEAAAAGTVPAVPRGSVEILYDGVEKLGNNAYKLTVDPEDGSAPEIFWGESQKECFAKLRKSKAHATKELRRRRNKLEITEQLRALEVERVEYAPLMQAISLTPKEIFDLTEQQKDPTTVLDATRKLRQASYTPEECARYNEGILRERFNDNQSTAQKWMENSDFFPSPENIASLKDLMGGLNWAVTLKNLDLAYQTLKDQEVYVPETKSPEPPTVQPAPVVPVTPVVTPAVPVVAPKAPAGALPAAGRVLRPGSSAENSTGIQPTVRLGARTGQPPQVQLMSAEEANSYSAADLKSKYLKDPIFKQRMDAYWAAGGR